MSNKGTVTSLPLANIERAELITETSTPTLYVFDTASEASAEASVSSGSEQELRIKNQILAQNDTEDIVKGYDITINESTFTPEVFALIDGGESTIEDSEFKTYNAPTAGNVVERTKSQFAVYSAEKDYDGAILGYIRFVFPHCKGTPASISIKDNEFYAPSYKLKSRPKKGESPVRIESIPALPTYVSTADEILTPDAGKAVYCTAAEITYNNKQYSIGEIIVVSAE